MNIQSTKSRSLPEPRDKTAGKKCRSTVSVRTRARPRPGDLFVALAGENFDGHKFVNDAFVRGAVGAVVEPKWSGKTPPDFALLRVADTLLAYQQIAAHYRRSSWA